MAENPINGSYFLGPMKRQVIEAHHLKFFPLFSMVFLGPALKRRQLYPTTKGIRELPPEIRTLA
ncbi:hypothetical protein PNH50_04305 [Leisingera aquaemixtae]|uniref:hypothetical protein n=1 Tax=Leisingera aquaemixtae TaxID=1396826 RepID=UPI003983E0B2